MQTPAACLPPPNSTEVAPPELPSSNTRARAAQFVASTPAARAASSVVGSGQAKRPRELHAPAALLQTPSVDTGLPSSNTRARKSRDVQTPAACLPPPDLPSSNTRARAARLVASTPAAFAESPVVAPGVASWLQKTAAKEDSAAETAANKAAEKEKAAAAKAAAKADKASQKAVARANKAEEAAVARAAAKANKAAEKADARANKAAEAANARAAAKANKPAEMAAKLADGAHWPGDPKRRASDPEWLNRASMANLGLRNQIQVVFMEDSPAYLRLVLRANCKAKDQVPVDVLVYAADAYRVCSFTDMQAADRLGRWVPHRDLKLDFQRLADAKRRFVDEHWDRYQALANATPSNPEARLRATTECNHRAKLRARLTDEAEGEHEHDPNTALWLYHETSGVGLIEPSELLGLFSQEEVSEAHAQLQAAPS